MFHFEPFLFFHAARPTPYQRGWGALLLASLLVMLGSSAIGAEVAWEKKSTTTGDLPIPNQGQQQTCCVAADFDGDGIEDFVVGERTKTPSIVWYRFNGKGWDKLVIDDTPLKPEAGGAVGDIDGDGDLDLILGQDASGNAIWWWENPCPQFDNPWKRHVIKNTGTSKHHDQTVADYDGDGRDELVTWNQKAKQLLMYDIPSDPRSGAWTPVVIYQWESGREHEGFPSIPVDLDLDGKVDLIGGGRWFKHTGGSDFQVHVIDDSMRFTQCAAGQLVEGGRPEVVFSPGDMDGDAKWYQWSDGKWQEHHLRFVEHGHTCEVRDIDGDGHLDIFIGEMGSPGAGDQARIFIWYGDGQGGLNQTVASLGQGIHEGLLSDLDGDGDLDILHKPYNHNSPRVDILLNQGNKP